jgi:hypothetical protein
MTGAVSRAKDGIEACRRPSGFVAGTDRYRDFWLRDLVFSEQVLLDLGHKETVRRCLESFLLRQRSTGQVPTVIASGASRIFNSEFQWWVADSEPLLVIGCKMYATSAGDESFLERHAQKIESCLRYVQGHRNRSGLLRGMDWRDAMTCYVGAFLLTNQMLLVDMLAAMERKDDSASLRNAVRRTYLRSGHDNFADCVASTGEGLEFGLDTLGNALALLNGTASPQNAQLVASSLKKAKTEFGYLNIHPAGAQDRLAAFRSVRNFGAFARNGAFLRNGENRYQNSAIWPFVEMRMARALEFVGRREEATEVARTITGRQGLNEWYDPVSGSPRGGGGQLWTAAAVIEAAEMLGREDGGSMSVAKSEP